MAKIIKRNVDTTIENNILTASILSTKYLEETFPIYSHEYLKNKFAVVVMKWILDYFDKFGEAPQQHIQSIFEIEKATLEEAELEIIKSFLTKLSENYVEGQGINVEYVLDQTLSYFRRREVEVRIEQAQRLNEVGKYEQAETVLMSMKKVVRQTSKWCDPFAVECVDEVFAEENNGIFRFPGPLGDMIGDCERGWLVSFLAPFKRGKTWMLQEAAVIGALSGLKTVFVSLEMKKKNCNDRLYKRLTAYAGEEKGLHPIPVFDCVRNQNGTCEKSQRKNKYALYLDEGQEPEFTPDMDYRACDTCRITEGEEGDYEVATWFEMIEKPAYDPYNVKKQLKAIKNSCGGNIRTICYPRFSASISDFERDLDLLEQSEGFIPDLIAADYADIFKSENSRGGETRNDIDEIWKRLAALAASRYALIFTASQGNRGSIYKDNMDQTDLAEWIGKLAHVDKFYALNQSVREKRKGVLRVGPLADRHREFHEKQQVMLLQALSLGQVHLDSHQIKWR